MSTNPSARVRGKRVVVTGGSRGIGRGLARELRRRGAQVAVVARQSELLEEAAAEVEGIAYSCDLADPSDVATLPARIEADGNVDVLVNNAGIESIGHATSADGADIDRLLQVNLHAPIRLCQSWLPLMLDRGGGHLVNVSSMAAVMAPPGLAAYAASKAGLTAYTSALRNDLRDLPIALSTVHIGTVDTEMTDRALAYGPNAATMGENRDRFVLTVTAAARTIVDGIEKGRADIAVPRAMAPLAAMAALPRAITRAMYRKVDLGPTSEQAGSN